MNLPALKSEDMALIMSQAPESYSANEFSSRRCCEYGQVLLERIEAEGMSDELDAQCAQYVEKSRKTLTVMNGRRSPVTKLFDMIRSGYTSMENSVDPSKSGSIPYRIQQARNAYVAAKRRQAEEQRRQEQQRQLIQQARTLYRADLEADLSCQLSRLITVQLGQLQKASAALTLDNFEVVAQQIRQFPTELDHGWFAEYRAQVAVPVELTVQECESLQGEVVRAKSAGLCEHYRQSVGEYRDTLTDNLPAKRRELEAIATADRAGRESRAAALAAAEQAELSRLEAERRQKEMEAAAVEATKAEAAQMEGLFAGAAMAAAAYEPKARVKYRLRAEDADGIYEVVAMWWAREGRSLSVEELSKIFRRQITFCERLANAKDSPEFIRSGHLVYEEEVKAR